MNKIQSVSKTENEFHLPLSVFITAYSTKFKIKNNTYPDCLIKINGKALLIYALETLERNYIDNVHILTSTQNFADRISEEINNYSDLIIKTSVDTINKDDEIDINEIKLFDKIESIIENKNNNCNFLILNSDLIIDVNIVDLYNTHVLNENFLTFIISDTLIKRDKKEKLQDFKQIDENLDVCKNFIYAFDSKSSVKKNNEIIINSKNEEFIKNDHYYKIVSLNSFNVSNNEQEQRGEINMKYLECNDFQLEDSLQNIEFYIFNRKIFDILKLSKINEYTELNNQILPFLVNYQNHRIMKSKNLDKPLQIYAYVKNDSCIKINDDDKILDTLNEMINDIDKINNALVLTNNNSENVFSAFRNDIINNFVNKKKANFNLPENLKNIYLNSYVSAKNIKLPNGKFSIKKSSIGSNFDLSEGEGTNITDSVLFNNIKIGKK